MGKTQIIDGTPSNSDSQASIIQKCVKNYIESSEKEITPSFTIGVTMGADLERWRDILEVIYNDRFSKYEEFTDAVLFYDSIDLKDSFSNSNPLHKEVLTDKLLIKSVTTSNGGLLHTKFILIGFVDEAGNSSFLLFVSSKNISNSTNYDLMLELKSKEYTGKTGVNVSKELTHGREIADYLTHLGISEIFQDKKQLFWDALLNVDFETFDEGEIIDFKFSYDKHHFDENWFKSVLYGCEYIISPFLDMDLMVDYLKYRKNNNKTLDLNRVTILAYREQLEKIQREMNEYTSSDVVDEWNKLLQGDCILGERADSKFHAKMYIDTVSSDGGCSHVYFGSANFSMNAVSKNYEMLVGIKYKNVSTDLFKSIKWMTEEGSTYVDVFKGILILDEKTDVDWKKLFLLRGAKYSYVRDNDNVVRILVKKMESAQRGAYFISDSEYQIITRWVLVENEDMGLHEEVYLSLENYLSQEEYQELGCGYSYISWEEFCEQWTKSISGIRERVFTSKLMESFGSEPGDGERILRGGDTVQNTRYPCFIKLLQHIALETEDETDEQDKKDYMLNRIKDVYSDFDFSADNSDIIQYLKMYREIFDKGLGS